MSKSDFDFARLIQPIEVDKFLQEYWEEKPLVVARNKPDYYSSLVSIEDIDSIIHFCQLKYSQMKLAKTEKESSGAENKTSNRVILLNGDEVANLNEIYNFYHQGGTLIIKELHNYWEPVANLCWELEKFFNYIVGVNMYFTPQNAQGFAPHFDTHDVFIVQVQGSKLWRIYDSYGKLPLVDKDKPPLPPEILHNPLHEVCLEAGDLLYIPRGCVHEAQTSTSSSIHLTVGIHVFRWADLIFELLMSYSQQNVSFRKALPVGFLDREETVELMKDQLPELLKLLTNSGKVEEAVERLRKRLIESIKPFPDGHFRSLDRVNQIDLDTMVAKRKGMMCRIAREENSVVIEFPGNRIKGPAYIEAALRFIADSSKDFPVRALPNSLSDKSKLVLVRRSIREGLLTIVDTKIARDSSLDASQDWFRLLFSPEHALSVATCKHN